MRGRGLITVCCFVALAFASATARAQNPPPSEADAKVMRELLESLRALEATGDGLAPAMEKLAKAIEGTEEQMKSLEAEIGKRREALAGEQNKLDAINRRLKALRASHKFIEELSKNKPKPAEPKTTPKPPTNAQLVGSSRGRELFGHKVGPILRDHCGSCHDREQKKGGLDLTTRDTMMAGGQSGAVVVPGKADESLLYKAVAHLVEPPMPYKKDKLPKEAIDAIKDWINEGAPFSDDAPVTKPERQITDADRIYWAFAPLTRPNPPQVKNTSAARGVIDQFILAKLEEKGIAPNPPADRRTLIRRAYFDLVGLPPTPQEVQAFINDPDEKAYERLIDRLLESPHFGERWARHWLDIARFAESHGYEHDSDRPHAYHYRDFVIKAFNMDLPYNKFVQWQIAGDEIAPNNPLAMMATGFLAAGTHSTQITKSQVEKERYDELDDMTGILGTAMLGMTVACARCHDHKFDPIPTKDYYRMISTFTTTVRSDLPIKVDEETYRLAKARYDREHAPYVDRLKKYEDEKLTAKFKEWLDTKPSDPKPAKSVGLDIAAFMKRARRNDLTEEQRAKVFASFRERDAEWIKLHEREREHAKQEPTIESVRVLVSSEGVPPIRLNTQGDDFLKETHFLKRGDPNQKGDVATQGFMQVLMRAPEGEKRWLVAPPDGARTSYRRRSLANWITDADQGAGHLLARVIVNRLWQHHMGRGIVATPSDFGAQGEPPTHPELLDWLASELISNGWRLKPIHKLIMMSATYQQYSQSHEDKLLADSENKLFWRYPRRRLEGEIVRDSMLAAAGLLDGQMFGPGSLDTSMRRRSIYFTVKRSKLIPMMMLFDGPDALGGLPRRATTTIAPQSLMLMNSQLARDCAMALAGRLKPGPENPIEQAVHSAYMTAISRPPADSEIADTIAFIEQQTESYKAAGKENAPDLAFADFCQVLMDLNEFVYVD